ncbi:MAG: lipoate--protein ligase family protein [Sulfolobales archaeon]
MKLRVINNLLPSDPNENLAIEEALNNVQINTSIIRFWVTKPSVILGRFDKVDEEVNIEFCLDNGIIISRRHSGGGTVYHDEGNLNISLTIPRANYLDISMCYKVLGWLLTRFINSLGVKTIYLNSNSLLINHKKVSGMAASLTKHSLHCHSTLLVSSDLAMLRHALKRLKSEVTNLSDEVGRVVTLSYTYSEIVDILKNSFSTDIIIDSLSDYEMKLANNLYLNKYSRDYWTYKI